MIKYLTACLKNYSNRDNKKFDESPGKSRGRI